jgi:hypothetical protein
MKTTAIIALVIGTILSPVYAEEAPKELWLRLSVEVQNLAWDLLRTDPNAAMDPVTLAEDLRPIDAILESLASVGEIEMKAIQLRSWNELGEAGDMRPREFLELVGKTHGCFVASYLMDLPSHRRVEAELLPNRPVTLRLRLPKKTLREFEVFAARHRLVKG